MEPVADYCGSLIALEGAPDVISTQLRLLPKSPQILVLPDIQHYLADGQADETAFSPRSFVRQIHEAAAARRQAALQFLADSRPDRKKLVFLSGGTVGAHALCLSAIGRSETQGDLERARSIFAELLKGGCAGLLLDESAAPPPEEEEEDDGRPGRPASVRNAGDALARAMRAADALDQETEGLQPSNMLELTAVRGRPRSLSLPICVHGDPLDATASWYYATRAGGSGRDDAPAPKAHDAATASPAVPEPMQGGGNSHSRLRIIPAGESARTGGPASPRRLAGGYEPASPCSSVDRSAGLSPSSETCYSQPTTPALSDGVVFGEAQVVQVTPPRPERSVKTVRSLDRMSVLVLASAPSLAQMAGDIVGDARRRSSLGVYGSARAGPGSTDPQPRFAKASKTLIRRNPPLKLILPAAARRNPLYVDRGTDAADWDADQAADEQPAAPFEPILPLAEDLIIHFVDDTTPDGVDSTVLESAMQTFKAMRAPPAAAQTTTSDDEPDGDWSGRTARLSGHADVPPISLRLHRAARAVAAREQSGRIRPVRPKRQVHIWRPEPARRPGWSLEPSDGFDRRAAAAPDTGSDAPAASEPARRAADPRVLRRRPPDRRQRPERAPLGAERLLPARRRWRRSPPPARHGRQPVEARLRRGGAGQPAPGPAEDGPHPRHRRAEGRPAGVPLRGGRTD